MAYSEKQAERIARDIFTKFDKQIVEACNGTPVTPKFVAGLVGNEAGKFKDGTINRGATRFEPGVYRKLIAVRDGKLEKYSGIKRHQIRDASDAAIKALSYSYEATQIMGYHCITLHCTLAELRDPNKHFHYTVKLLLLNGYPEGADNSRMAREMREWNTGSETGKTFHEDYVPNAERVRAAYAKLEKERLSRTVEERLIGTRDIELLGAGVSESIEIPATATCPNCGLNAVDSIRFDGLCSTCGMAADSVLQDDPNADKAAPEGEAEEEDTPTGKTTGDPPQTDVQPTKLKGWVVAVVGAISTFLGSIGSWFAGLPPIVLAAMFIGGGLATSALIVSVIWIKNQREARAAAKELELIRSKR